MEKQKISKITEVMQKAEKLVMEEVNGKPEDQLVVAAGLMAQKVFEVMIDSFIMADEIYLQAGQYDKPTIH
jgi:hypothetical protein